MHINDIISSLDCFTDLHLHLDGSVSTASARELAVLENVVLPDDDSELSAKLMVSDDCRDLNEYLEKFALPVSLMQCRESLELAAYNLCCELKAQGLMYAEIRFAPQKHCEKGLSQHDAVTSVLKGIERSGFDAGLILCCMRDGADNRAENLETVRLVSEFLGKGVCASDLAGAEALFPNSRYIYVFEEARRLNVPFTLHSGEALGYESVITAVENGASRIGHGVRAAEDEYAMELLRSRGVSLEICPTSNINTCVYREISDIPVKKLMDYGINVTVNTDNLSVSCTNIKKEFMKISEAFGFDAQDVKHLLENSVNASFTDSVHKKLMLEKINMEFEKITFYSKRNK